MTNAYLLLAQVIDDYIYIHLHFTCRIRVKHGYRIYHIFHRGIRTPVYYNTVQCVKPQIMITSSPLLQQYTYYIRIILYRPIHNIILCGTRLDAIVSISAINRLPSAFPCFYNLYARRIYVCITSKAPKLSLASQLVQLWDGCTTTAT